MYPMFDERQYVTVSIRKRFYFELTWTKELNATIDVKIMWGILFFNNTSTK